MKPYYRQKKGVGEVVHPWREGCASRKFHFSSQDEAELYAKVASTRDMRAYHCPICGRWALTSNTGEERVGVD